MALGADAEGELANTVAERTARQKPGHCCTLIYTSGTTGAPKAVMINHDNLVWTARCLIEYFDGMKPGPHEFLSYLPLRFLFSFPFFLLIFFFFFCFLFLTKILLAMSLLKCWISMPPLFSVC